MDVFGMLFISGAIFWAILVGIEYNIYRFVNQKTGKKYAVIITSIIPILFAYYLFNEFMNIQSNDISEFSTIIFIFVLPGALFFLYVCLPLIIAFYVYKYIKRWIHKYIVIALVSIIPLLFYYPIFRAIYPDDGFFKVEFKTVTELEYPESGEVIKKHATVPFFHPDYQSYAIIKLSEEDFRYVLDYVKNNNIFKEGGKLHTVELGNFVGSKRESQIIYIATNEKKSTGTKLIGFLDDNRTIIIHIFKS